MYSNIKTMTSGAMKPANFGTNFNLAFKPLNLTSSDGSTQSEPQSFDSIVTISTGPTLVLSFCFRGERSKNQNVSACIAGITSIRRSTSRGDIPSAIRPAQLNEPTIPADPVPDDQAVITFLMYRYERKI